MGAEDINIDIGDPSAYLSSAQQIQAANESLSASFGQVTGTSGTLHKALELVTPGRAAIAAWAGMAVEAASVQSALGGLRATSSVTGASMDKLTGTMKSLAQSFPIGNQASQALVTQFTKMGVATSGSEAKIAGLSKVTTQYAGATGQGLSQAAQGLADLSRATGNVSLDVKPMRALSDSVTSVSAKMGAGSEAIQDFGKNIAPMANVAGIGAAGVVGISGAFAKLGEDGIGATTAVNKMLSDMSRSVRDGTPDLAIYSSAVGKTTKEFTALYKANPAEALTQVTEAISKSSSGPRLLEQLGLDSVRTMKSLTALSASGGLRPAIAAGIAGYDSGATEKASGSAFEGLNSSATELTSTLQQLSESLGAPLLEPLTAFTKALTVPAKFLAGIAGNSAVQKVAGVAMTGVAALGTAALSVLLLKGIPKLIGNYAMGRQMLTSGPVSSAAAGYASGARLGPESATFRRGLEARKMIAAGTLESGMMGGANTRLYEQGVKRGEQDFHRRGAIWADRTAAGGAWSDSKAGQKVVTRAKPALYSEAVPAVRAKHDRQGNLIREAQPRIPAQVIREAQPTVRAYQDPASAAQAMRTAQLADQQTTAAVKAAAGPSGLRAGMTRVGLWGRALAGSAYDMGTASINQGNTPASERGDITGSRKATDAENKRITERNLTRSPGRQIPLIPSERIGMTPLMKRGLDAGKEAGGGFKSPITMLRGMDAGFHATATASKQAAAAEEGLTKQTGILAGAFSSVSKRISANTGMFVTGAKDATQAVGVAGKAGAWAAGGLSMLTSPMMVAMGAMALGTKIKGEHDKKVEAGYAEKRAFDASDIYAISNAYRASAGQATKTAIAQTAVAAPTKTPPMSTLQSVTGAVTPEELASAKTGGGPIHKFAGTTNADVIAQMKTANVGGLTPAELEPYRVDLIKQGKSPLAVKQIMEDYAKDKQIITPEQEAGGFATSKGHANLPKGQGTALIKAIGTNPDVMDVSGSSYVPNPLTTNQKDAITGVTAGIAAAFKAEQDRAGSVSAAQGQYRAATQTYGEMKSAGASKEELATFSTRMFTQMAPNGKSNRSVTDEEFDKYKGNFAEILKARDPHGEFANTLATNEKSGLSTSMDPNKGVKGETLPGTMSDMLKSAGDQFGAAVFNQNNTSAFGKSISALVKVPGNAELGLNVTAQAQAWGLKDMAMAKTDTGKGTSDAALNNVDRLTAKIAKLNKTLGSMDASAPEAIALTRARDALSGQVGAQQMNMTPSQQMVANLRLSTADANIKIGPTTSPEIVAKQAKGVEDTVSNTAAIQARLQQRLEAQRTYETAVTRTIEAANIARKNSNDAYDRSVVQAKYSFNVSQTNANQDYQTAVTNSLIDFNLGRKNEIRDYNINVARIEADFLLQRKNAIRDFNISIKHMIEDAAANMYDPYARIQTKATWDVKNLMVNLTEQNAAMVKQKAQLNELRKEGLSQQVIDQLQLGKAENAQQVLNMTEDLKGNPNDIKALNKLGAARQSDAGALTTDASNVSYVRSKAEFNKNMKDQDAAHAIQTKRSGQELAKTLRDQLLAFNVTSDRGLVAHALQLKRSNIEFTHSLTQMATENRISREIAAAALQTSLKNMKTDLTNTDISINGTFSQLQGALIKTMQGKSHTYTGLLVNDSQTFLTNLRTTAVGANTFLAPFGLDIKVPVSHAASPSSTTSHSSAHGKGSMSGGQTLADGGRVGGSSPHPKADNIPIWATAGEWMQPVSAVQHYGTKAMEAVRTKKAQISFAEGGLIQFANELKGKHYSISEHPMFGGVHPVHAPGSQHYNKAGPGGGGAIDVNHDQSGEDAALSAIVSAARKHNLRTLWHIAGHFNHAHFDISTGPDMIGADIAPGIRSGGGGGFDGVPSGGMGGVMRYLTSAMLFKSMDAKRKGWYGLFRDGIEKKFNKKYPQGFPYQDIGSGGGVTMGDLGSGSTNAQKVFNTLTGLGFTPQSAAGVIGNLMQESGVNPHSQQSGGPGRGIMQWSEGQRWATLQSWAGKRDPWSLDTQVGFMLKEMNDRGFTNSFKQIPNVVPATNRFEQVMEAAGTPNMANRIRMAQAAMAKFGQPTHDTGGMIGPGRNVVQNNTGKPEALLNDKQWGMVKQMVTQEQSKTLHSGACSHMTVNNNQNYSYDNRNDFGNANITVMSQDPDDMARRLDKRATAQRLNQTRGVQWQSQR